MGDSIEYTIQRLKRALELQNEIEGKIVTTPTVEYCFECDEIAVDEFLPKKCLYHKTAESDGYEHGGIQAAITALESVQE